MSASTRLKNREISIFSRTYLTYKALWPRLEEAIGAALGDHRGTVPTVLDLGCGERPYEDLFEGTNYVGLNYDGEGASPDVIADAQSLPIASNAVDIVFTTQVIEHLPYPASMLGEASRVLRPGGALILSGPFYWPLHEEPFDFYRFTKYGLERLLSDAGFTDIRIVGDCGALTQVAVSVIEVMPRVLRPLIPLINLVTPWLQRRSRNSQATLNYVVRAKKPLVPISL